MAPNCTAIIKQESMQHAQVAADQARLDSAISKIIAAGIEREKLKKASI
jgi:hypothetical protein